jgi:FtsP/CotA-like multicopper oxidase with cupredoxin domain
MGSHHVMSRLVHALTLSYGGVALLEWLQHRMSGAAAPLVTTSPAQWLRDGTLVLPVVGLAVVLGRGHTPASAREVPGGVAALFAVIMGVGALLQSAGPGHAGMIMDGSGFSSLAIGQQFLLTLLIAWTYAMLVGRTLSVLGAWIEDHLAAPHLPQRLVSAVWVGVIVLAVVPATLLLSTGQAVAQTSFPDHTIHPRGQLTLIARKLDDNSLAYVAPEYGAEGVRPTIEMFEGETLNITLINTLDADVSLHVHGVLYSPDSDGTRHNNSFVRPGEQRVYQWRAAPGTAGYWHYHDHVMGDNEGTAGISGGLYGGLVVRKVGDREPVRTFVLVFHNYSVNGRLYPDTPMPTAREGELVEFLVVSYMDTLHTFHLHGHRWLTPARTADPDVTSPANLGSGHEDNHILAPGDSFGFLAVAGQGVGPGMWMYHCHVQSHSGGMMGFFNVLPADAGLSPTPGAPSTP